MATIYANRLLLAHLFHGIRRFGIPGSVEIIKADHKGRRMGKKQHKVVNDRTIQFYSNPELRPEFGNVPLMKKFIRKLNIHG